MYTLIPTQCKKQDQSFQKQQDQSFQKQKPEMWINRLKNNVYRTEPNGNKTNAEIQDNQNSNHFHP